MRRLSGGRALTTRIPRASRPGPPPDHRPVDGGAAVHLLPRLQHRVEAVVEHLRLVLGDGLDERWPPSRAAIRARQSAAASRRAVLAPTPRPGVMVWMASPSRVTEDGGQGASGTEVRMLIGKQVPGRSARTAGAGWGASPGVISGTRRSESRAASLHARRRGTCPRGREAPVDVVAGVVEQQAGPAGDQLGVVAADARLEPPARSHLNSMTCRMQQ